MKKYVGIGIFAVLQFTGMARADSSVQCGPYTAFMYQNGALIVNCLLENGTPGPTFMAIAGDSPSPADVTAFLQPYSMTIKQLQATSAAGLSAFNQRPVFYYLGSKITGFRMMTK